MATAASALLTWILQVAAGRLLELPQFVAFTAVWGLFFSILGVLQGVLQETARSVSAVHTGHDRNAPVAMSACLVGVGLACLTVGLSPLWTPKLVDTSPISMSLPFAATAILYSMFNAEGGALAGRQAWGRYAGLIMSEGVLRWLLVGGALLWVANPTAVAWSLCAGGFVCLVLLLDRGYRDAIRDRGDVTVPAALGWTMQSMVASGCSALCLAGFPFLLTVTARAPLPSDAAVLIAAVISTRAPVLIALNAYQAAVLSRFVRNRSSMRRDLMRIAGTLLAVTSLGCALGLVLGPALLRLVYGDRFLTDGVLFVPLVLSVGLLAMLTVTGTACLALGDHPSYAVGWVVTMVGTAAILALPLELQARATLALIVSPSGGLMVHLVSLSRLPRGASVAESL